MTYNAIRKLSPCNYFNALLVATRHHHYHASARYSVSLFHFITLFLFVCLAFLTVLAQKGLFQITSINDVRRSASSDIKTLMQTAEDTMDNPPLVLLFAEAVKGPLLSPDSQVQVATLDLLFLFLSWEDVSGKEIEVFVEQNIADYAFEILRLSVDSSQTKGA